MLAALIGLVISLQISTPIDCNALYIFNSVTGNLAILTASTSLMIRTIALWERQLKVVIPLCILCLAHWAILWRSMFLLAAVYDPTKHSCTVWSTNHVFLNVEFFMTMIFDLIILCFTVVALYAKHKSRSDLWHLLFRDGLVYFFITFFCNALPAVFNVLNLNTIMNIIATIPAATIASIAACRLVIRLQQFNQPDSYIQSTSPGGMSEYPRSPLRFTNLPNRRYTMPRRPEVLVTTDHYVMEDFHSSPASLTPSPITPLDKVHNPLDVEDEKDYDGISTRSSKHGVQSLTCVV
ncbi:unnamed protein product [Somion occarium]